MKRRNPTSKARRWVVEVSHSWFNRFRKLLVRYEKLERSFVALNHLAAAIIAFRKVNLKINIIYGYVLTASASHVGSVRAVRSWRLHPRVRGGDCWNGLST